MQARLLEDLLDIIPREDQDDKNLKIPSYTAIFEYLIKYRLVSQYQWCLDNFKKGHIDTTKLITRMRNSIEKKDQQMMQE